jgi:hypothetical protein
VAEARFEWQQNLVHLATIYISAFVTYVFSHVHVLYAVTTAREANGLAHIGLRRDIGLYKWI